MLEEETVLCPVCENEIKVKVFRSGKNTTYVVPNDCNKCKTPASKIENSLNKSNKRSYVKVERSYFKLDPRG